jgi:uncharacterized Rmd1/YagE family protein
MATARFKAAALTSEIDLNAIAAHFGIRRKYRWEDSLALGESALQGVVLEPAGKSVRLFSFGSVVFVNCQHHEIMDVIRYLGQVDSGLAGVGGLTYTDDYRIEVSAEEEPSVNNDCLAVSREEGYQREMVATVLAKSVALERTELGTNALLDEIEDVVALLGQGRLTMSDEQLARMSARILGFRLSTLSYIMLLDKPDITWVNEGAAELYNELGALFELADRYESIRHKTEALMDITTVFAGLSHAKRGNRLEWAVIILIAIEIVLSVADMVLR